MDNQIWHFKIIGIILIAILGTLFHYVYKWSNFNSFVGLFVPVNESVWEHLKLLFFPTLLFTLIEYFFYGKKYPNYITSVTIGVLAGLLSIIVLYFTYSGILGTHVLWIDIVIFILSIIISQFVSYFILIHNLYANISSFTSLLLLISITLMFFYFTYHPPLLNLFKDPMQVT